MTDANHSITVRRLIQTQRTQVFNAFSRSEALAQWFTPAPDIAVEVLAFKFELEGHFRLRFTMPDSTHKVVGGRYTLITAPEQLAFSWIWEQPDPHAGLSTHVHIQFLEQDDATEIVLTHEQLPSEESGVHHAAGWQGILDNFERTLTTAAAQ